MKMQEFTYKKANGDESHRAVIVDREPSAHMEGIDVSELDMDSLAGMMKDLNELSDLFKEKRAEILVKYDAANRYRRFIPANMSDVISTHL